MSLDYIGHGIDPEYTGNPFPEMHERIEFGKGFIAALDQSGGSTPKALSGYYDRDMTHTAQSPQVMYDLIHQFRSRVMGSPSFNANRLIGAILFEDTLKRYVNGLPTAHYLWREKSIVPFLKVDEGLDDLHDGVQLMKPIKALNKRLELGVKHTVFGTKMRSVIHENNETGIQRVVEQQFQVAEEIFAYGLVPIIEPEVNIHSEEKAAAEETLVRLIEEKLDGLGDREVMLKLSLPTTAGLYENLMNHPNVLRTVALSGGYPATTANNLLRQNPYLIASFSRVLLAPLKESMTQYEFDKALSSQINDIYRASVHGMDNVFT